MKRDNEKNRRLQRELKKSEVALRKAGIDILTVKARTKSFMLPRYESRGGEGFEIRFTGEFLFDWGDGTIRLYRDYCSHVYKHGGTYSLRIDKRVKSSYEGLSCDPFKVGSFFSPSQVVGEEIPEDKPVKTPVIKKPNIPYDVKGGALDEFVTVWRVKAGDKVIIPAWGDYRIDWGDRTIDTLRGVKQSCEHVYAKAGDYEVRVSNTAQWGGGKPTFSKLKVADMLIDVKQWGSTQWTDMTQMFSCCKNMNMSATDAPNLSFVYYMDGMFSGCEKFNGAIGHWDVSNIKSMGWTFSGCDVFTGEIGGWDVSNVEYMLHTFSSAKRFNTKLERWDVSKVRNISFMFCHADAFCQDLHNWNVGMVEFEEHRSLARPTKKLVCMETRMTGNPNFNKWYGYV